MTDVRGRRRPGGFHHAAVAILLIAVASVTGSCRRTASDSTAASAAVLRVGWGQGAATNPLLGLRQLSQILTLEGLARTGEDGRMQPSMALGWTVGNDGRSLTVKLRPNMKF